MSAKYSISIRRLLGQVINKEKSSIMFSRSTSNDEKQELLSNLDIVSEARNEKYLGLQVYMGRSK
jgi:hypothetical protein